MTRDHDERNQKNTDVPIRQSIEQHVVVSTLVAEDVRILPRMAEGGYRLALARVAATAAAASTHTAADLPADGFRVGAHRGVSAR